MTAGLTVEELHPSPHRPIAGLILSARFHGVGERGGLAVDRGVDIRGVEGSPAQRSATVYISAPLEVALKLNSVARPSFERHQRNILERCSKGSAWGVLPPVRAQKQ